MSAIDQSAINRTDSGVSVSPATEEILSVNEISRDGSDSSDTIDAFSAESSSTLLVSQSVGESEDELQSAEDDPTAPLVPPKYEKAVPSIAYSENRTSEPPKLPSLIQCMCCCYITYNINENTPIAAFETKKWNSNFTLFILAALLSIPISSIYFGVTYKGSCPMVEFLPVLLILMGVVGMILIVNRLVTLCAGRCLCNVEERSKIISISLTFMLTVFLIMEMIPIYTRKPVFDNPKDPVFCAKAFYDYVFYTNFAVLVIGILALLLHLLKIHILTFSSAERVLAREHYNVI